MAHKGIPKLVAPCIYCLLLYCTLYNYVHVLKLTCNLAYYSHSSGKMCLLFQHNSHQNKVPILCLKLCWHNLPGPIVIPCSAHMLQIFYVSLPHQRQWSAPSQLRGSLPVADVIDFPIKT